MSAPSSRDRTFLAQVAQLAYCNPFLPERVDLERAALGRAFVAGGPVWSAVVSDPDGLRPNVVALFAKLNEVLERMRAAMAAGPEVSGEEFAIYEDSVHYFLYQRYLPRLIAARGKWPFYSDFLRDRNRFLAIPGKQWKPALEPEHAFACFYQLQRAFHHIYDNIIGNSMPAARLRASVWQSIFTHDMRRYRRTLYRKMGEFPTLITGPSGSGKELIARAIAGSRYIPFDVARSEFHGWKEETMLPINIAALSPALVESELFGHRRGSFTGAVGDRKGWLETCTELGSVFLDELGEMDLSVQVKLLRVMETRRFSPVGDTALREFHGKLIAATNRDLQHEIGAGRFREDLYYRLCADLIQTPSLADQIRDSPGVLGELLQYMTQRTAGEETGNCLAEVTEWVRTNLPGDYGWPGNYRELEQCVRNIIIRRSYRPLGTSPAPSEDGFVSRLRAGELSADEMLACYAAQVYRMTGSYEKAAARMKLDRRTVKAKVELYLQTEGR
jgi:transcriptional regulator with AAA-type ATPase domain